MVVKRWLMSRMLPIPKETVFVKNISICHFIMNVPNANPIKKRIIDKGKNLTTILYSFTRKAGFRKNKIWLTRSGNEIISPVATPQLIARLIN